MCTKNISSNPSNRPKGNLALLDLINTGILLSAVMLFAQCGNTELNIDLFDAGGDSDSDTDTDSDSDSDSDGDSDTYVSCPEQPPKNGDNCVDHSAGQVLYCSWGDDPRYQCRTRAECRSSQENDGKIAWKWTVTEPNSEQCGDLLPPECPNSVPQARDLCDSNGITCHYGDGEYCVCTKSDPYPCYPVCQELEDPIWQCISPPDSTNGCPKVSPNAGAACSLKSGTRCSYTCEHIMTCIDGTWVYQGDQCPICAAPDTPIATPEGDRFISELVVGDLVYSVDGGQTVVVPVLRTSRTKVFQHHAVLVTLLSGSKLLISAGHPTADGRDFGDLSAGDYLGSQEIVEAKIVPYPYDYTYDILPDSSTGFYVAGGALIGSTLAR